VGEKALALIALPIAITMLFITTSAISKTLIPRTENAFSQTSQTGLLPFDRIATKDMQLLSDTVRINIQNAQWATYSDTGSMLPVLGPTANALQIIPLTPKEVHPGDIVSFWHDNKVISHRIIAQGEDEQGTYYVTKGDNNPAPDPMKVRFEQIDRILVGILY
jgi:hypothetical protein